MCIKSYSVGYCEYERYFHKKKKTNIRDKYKNFSKKNTILFATGFQFSHYTDADIINAGDLIDNTRDDIDLQYEIIKNTRDMVSIYRDLWISNILKCAIRFPEILFIVKNSPLERLLSNRDNKDDYCQLKNIKNIYLVQDSISVLSLLDECSMFFHYGSTTLASAYIQKVPSVYIKNTIFQNNNCDPAYSDLGWESNYKIEIDDLDKIIQSYLDKKIIFTLTNKMKNTLNDFFNINDRVLLNPKLYNPSYKIAKIISTHTQKNRKMGIPFILYNIEKNGFRKSLILIDEVINKDNKKYLIEILNSIEDYIFAIPTFNKDARKKILRFIEQIKGKSC
jgi:hypothetical protein